MQHKTQYGRPTRSHFRRPQHGRPHGGGHGSRPHGKRRMQTVNVSYLVNKVTEKDTAPEVTYVAKHRFSDFAIDEKLKVNIQKKGYQTPTPIQDQSIPHVLAGSDVLGLANTGTGKTAAFLIPLIHKVIKDPRQKVLVMVPTRELAIQIEQELRGFTMHLGIFSVCLVGGVGIGPQLKMLRHKNNFFIGTPGRIKDVIERKALSLSDVHTVVLDEADRMLDMGFVNDMRRLMAMMPKERQTLFFSATLSPEIQTLVREFLKNPVSVSVKSRDTSKNIDQDIVRLKPGQDKFDTLITLLNDPSFQKVIIFSEMKHRAQKLSDTLEHRGIKADAIHGNKNHGQRQRALGRFKNGEIQVLVATDVAARGLDIPNVSHVINYDLPSTYDSYVHRIGRTGRGENIGKALTFIE